MGKSPDAFRTISEVAEWLGVQAHVLRFWESKFSQVKPVKRAGGRRYYRPADMQLLGGIKKLLHDDGMTIKGVQKALREQGVSHIASFSQSLDDSAGADLEDDGNVVKFHAPKQLPAGAVQIDMDLGEDNGLGSLFPDIVSEPLVADGSDAPNDNDDDEVADGVKIVTLSAAGRLEDEAEAEEEHIASEEGSEIVDASDEETEAPPGLLGLLSQVTVLTPASQAEIQPLVDQLKGWLSRQAG
ncbi:MerR family transcriptional regulator [Ruegeria sp. WL0004]|uniref:MerR family transcriptional regulator n=1 Tax=Ruegeria marisflavi TaxID=2984152 RepID=A0ABT2WNV6_9RHOB|nr:MerR family transcriptional regulator [Ruegeria sp. WL0004]MCU9836922.1 MerR family transcriptional regulator [Ruegeria sp. WL0004]